MSKHNDTTGGVFSGMSGKQRRLFKKWQARTITMSIVGYAMFYLVRKNLSVAMPFIENDLGISKSDLGIFLTLHGLVYGLSKFINGIWGDRSNARWFLVSGIVITAVCNILFGVSTAVITLGIFWILNGWFQGMGVPPCTRLMTHWVPPGQLATKMSLWNTSHSIGAGLAIVLCGYIVGMDWAWSGMSAWRWCFILPAAIALVGALFVWIFIRDTPKSVGLPEMNLSTNRKPEQELTSHEEKAAHRAFLMKHVFLNPVIWVFALGNFFLYTVRFTVLDWGPTMLKEHLGMDIASASWSVAAFEVAGILGMLTAGWITDRVFRGRAARTCVICMLMVTLCLVGLYTITPQTPMIAAIGLLMVAGFFIYGPQALVGIAAANIGTNKAAATAGGFCGLFGYASTIVSGWGIGLLVERTGWNFALGALIVVALTAAFIFLLAWRAKPHGYETE